MGKAARIRAEHRREREATPPEPTHRTFPLFWLVVALVALMSIVAAVASRPSDAERSRDRAAADAPVFGDVRVTGTALPTWTGTGPDPAVGARVPRIVATDLEGETRALDPTDGVARAYVVVAHWCPHCNAEVPRIVEWARSAKLGTDVEVVAVSTAADKGQPNYPPATWLAREQWPFPAVVDDEIGTASEALGVEGFPFLVFVDREGRVTERASGELPIDEFAAAMDELGATGAGSS